MTANAERLSRSATFLGWTIVFALAYCQAPLYYSNQNQYFLHGLAAAGQGHLGGDWLANTADPTAIFSLLVELTARYLPEPTFHLYYALLLGVYFAAALGLFTHLMGQPCSWRLQLAFAALFVAIHSALARWGSHRVFGWDYPWYLQAGVAGQYVLGAMLQPSTFGVLLVLSIWWFVKDRPFAAVFAACLGATVHSTYVLGAGMLTLGYMWVLYREGRVRQAAAVGAWALVLILPVIIFVLVTFRPTSAEAFAEAQHIVAHFRIPHHSLPELWCDTVAMVQIAWLVLALILGWGTRLWGVFLVTLFLSLLLTLLQIATQSDTLALLFPWRISAVLMPVATAVIVARLVGLARRRLDTRAPGIASAAVLAFLAAGGLAITVFEQGFQSSPDEARLMDFVRTTKSPGDVYLIPVRVPDLKKIRGSQNSDFKPLAARQTDTGIIPIDLQRFRLSTGAAIFVDFKSIPYKDTDVLEWRQRLDFNQQFYNAIGTGKLQQVLDQVRRSGITHIVVTGQAPIGETPNLGLEKVFDDGSYRLYRLTRPAND